MKLDAVWSECLNAFAMEDVLEIEMILKRVLSKSLLSLSAVFCFSVMSAISPVFASEPEETIDGVGDPTFVIRPELIYRMSSLGMRDESAFHRETKDKDFVDQLYATLRFQADWDYKDFMLFELGVRTPRSAPDGDLELVVQQGFIESLIAAGKIGLTVGKKVEYEGPAIVMNPSDLLNEDKDLIDPLYQREGKFFTRFSVNGVALQGAIPWKAALGFIPLRSTMAGNGKIWLQSQAQLAGFDLKLQSTSQKEDGLTTGYSISKFIFGDSLELHIDGRYQSHQRGEGDQRERAFSAYPQNKGSNFYVAGSRILLRGKRSLTIEAMVNESGLTSEEFEEYFSVARDMDDANIDKKPESRFLGRRYGFLAYHDEDSFSAARIGASILYNVEDQSTFANIEWRKTISPLVVFSINPTFFSGKSASEFGEMPFSSIVYFQMIGRI